jgi:putative oxidoreductase
MVRSLTTFLFGARPSGSTGSELILLAARVFTGLGMAIAHGLGKLPPSGQFVQGVAKLGFPSPEVFAWMSAAAEFGCGLLLAIGLLVRPAALAIAINMAVAGFLAHAADPFGTRERALLYLALALVFLAIGGGRFSIDRRIQRRL